MSISKPSRFETKKVTTLRLKEMKSAGVKIAALTAYDFTMAKIIDKAGIDLILVGDSLGNVVQGNETTISVTMDETIYHTKTVVKAAERALVVADMPFMSYQVSGNEAFRNAGRLMKETNCSAVKLEGGGENIFESVYRMTSAGIPVMGHLGLTPQSINQFGSYRARGTNDDEAEQILKDAKGLEDAGAFAIVIEKIPADLGNKITESITIPTIGIGAGPHCDGQILVYTDMLGLTIDFNPRFVRKYANMHEMAIEAFSRYTQDIKTGDFPSDEESY